MTQTATAIYENGVLRPTSPLSDLRDGQKVQLTVQILEELTPEEEARREDEFEKRMEAAGMIEHLSPPDEPAPADWTPLVLAGEPLSETVIRMRRED